MTPEQVKIQNLETQVAELMQFVQSLHNPSQYNATLTKALIEVVFNTVKLTDLSDVDTTGVTNNQVIKYSTGTLTWTPADDIDT